MLGSKRRRMVAAMAAAEEQQVLRVPVNEDTIESFTIYDCAVCGRDFDDEPVLYVWIWGEPLGSMVALKVHCSEECVKKSIAAYGEKHQVDIRLVWKVRG